MAAFSSGSPSVSSPFYVDNDEETYSFLLEKGTDVGQRLDPLFERIRQDPIDTAPWTAWTEIVRQKHGIAVPTFSTYQPEKPTITQKIPESFDTPTGQAHLKSIQAVLQIDPTTAAQITLSCMRDVPSQPDQVVYGSHALFEKVLDYAYRQRLVRLRVIAEALLAERDENHGHGRTLASLLDGLDNKCVVGNNNQDKRGIFVLLLLHACATETELLRDQLLPCRELWVVSAQEKRNEATKDAEWKALARRVLDRHASFVLNARKEALEALATLLYSRMELTRADYATLLTAFGEQDFFTKFAPRMSHLAGLICMEACLLVRTTQGEDWVKDHNLMRGTDANSAQERSALVQMLEAAVHGAENNKPQGLAALSFGCLLHLAGYSEGYDLAGMAIDVSQADVSLEETLTHLVEPPVTEPGFLDPEWIHASDVIFDINKDDEGGAPKELELKAPCMIYASVGREVVVALLWTFRDLLLDPRRNSHLENMNVVTKLVQISHSNSSELCDSTWGEWVELKSDKARIAASPLCQVICLSRDLAMQCLDPNKRLQPLQVLEVSAPILKLIGSLVSCADYVRDVIEEEILPPALLHTCFVACQASSTDPEKMRDLREDILRSVSQLVRVAQTDKNRAMIRDAIATRSLHQNTVIGPQELFRIGNWSPEALRLTTVIVAGLLPGASTEWFIQASLGLDTIQNETKNGNSERGKGSTEALVHLTYTMVLYANDVFFTKAKEGLMKNGLNQLLKSLMAIMNVCVRATSALSRNSFEGKPLPLDIASKILVTLGNALIVLRPLYCKHSSKEVQDMIEGIVDTVVQNVGKKAGLGDSVLYYASLPATLGLAFEMREMAKDVELARTARGNRRSWGLSAGTTATSSNLEAMLISLVSDLDDVPVNLNAMEANGWLEEESAEGVQCVSLAAMRLLLLVFEHLDSIEEGRQAPSTCHIYELIMSEAILSRHVRRSSHLLEAWSASRVSYMQLIIRQLRLEGKKEESICLVGFRLLGNYIAKVSSPNMTMALGSLPLLGKVIDATFEKLKKNVAADSPVGEAQAKFAASCIHFLTKCIESNVHVVDLKGESEKWTVVVDFVLAFGKRKTTESNPEIILVEKCLQLLLSLRKRQNARNDEDYFTASQSFMSEVASLALKGFHQSSLLPKQWSSSTVVQKSKALQLVSAALEFLTLEIQRASSTSSADSTVFSCVIGVFEDVQGLSIWIDEALKVSALDEFMKRLLGFPGSSGRNGRLSVLCDLMTLFGNENATESLLFWLGLFRSSDQFWRNFAQNIFQVRALYVYLKHEMTRAAVASHLLSLLYRERHHLKGLAAGFTGATCLRVAHCMDNNMESIEVAADPSALYSLVSKISGVTSKTTFLLAEMTKDCGLWERSDVSALLEILLRNCKRANGHKHPAGIRQHRSIEGNLLLVAVTLTSSADVAVDARIGGDLVERACHTLKQFDVPDFVVWQGKPEDVLQASKVFRICVGLLRHVCKCAMESEDSQHFSAVLSKILVANNTASVLVRCACDPMRQRIGTEGVLSAFRLFQAISILGNKPALSSLISGIRPALAGIKVQPKSDIIAGVVMRGYVSLRSNSIQLNSSQVPRPATMMHIGLDDDLHEIQLAGTNFVSCALRSIACSQIFADDTSKHMRSIALDYLSNYKDHLLQDLHQVSRPSFDSVVKDLTIRSLREATATLSLVAEMCRRHCIEDFRQKSPELFKSFVVAATAVARSLCSFLGASGASRELFRALGEEEGGEQDSGLGLSPLAHVISLSLSNPRHEAIRYSHFVSRWSAAVTQGEHALTKRFPGSWKPPRGQEARDGTNDPHSESALERKCKESIASEFAFDLEVHASKCLFHAIDIILKTHPTTCSFIMFTPDELRRMEQKKFVEVGTVVAFQDYTFVSTPQTRYGKVCGIDLSRRTLEVTSLEVDAPPEPVTISMSMLTGIEDNALRRPALKFAPAPESSAEAEKQGSNLSVGHLISALRWCHEYTLQMGQKNFVSQLAEILSVLLGMEVSLAREEPQKCGNITKEVVTTLSIQLLDLFGADMELSFDDEAETSYSSRRGGRLHLLLSDQTWNAMRHEIRPELDSAIKDLQARREKKRTRSFEGDSWLAIRRSPSTRSPFRQLSV